MYQRSINSRRSRVAAGVLSLAFIAAACGSSKAASTTTAGAATTAGATTAAPTTAAPVATSAQVSLTTAAATTVAAAASTTVAAAEKPTLGGTLRVGLESGVSTLDPAQSLTQPADKDIALSIFDPLVSFDKDNKFIPFLAESVSSSDDLKVWTVTLRKGVKFQDGTDLNADAVIAHWKRMSDPATKSSWASKAVEQVPTKKDDLTVIFTMTVPAVGFPNDLATAMGFIPSPTAVAKDPVGFGLNPVGTGPFKISKFEAGGEVVVEKNAAYWGKDASGTQLPYLDKISFKGIADTQKRLQALQNGEFDLIQTADPTSVAAASKDTAKLKVQRVTGTSSGTLMLNHKDPVLSDLRVRQALAYAYDPATLIKVQYDGALEPSYSVFATNSPYFNKAAEPIKFNLDKAKALVKEYGKPIEITMECVNTPEYNTSMELIKSQWEAAGIKVTLKGSEQGAYVARMFGRKGDYQVACFRTGQFAEPDQTRDSYTTDAKANLVFYSNKEVDKLYLEAAATTDFAKRKAAHDQIQVDFAKDVLGIPLYYNVFGNITSTKVSDLPNAEGNALGAIRLGTVYLKK